VEPVISGDHHFQADEQRRQARRRGVAQETTGVGGIGGHIGPIRQIGRGQHLVNDVGGAGTVGPGDRAIHKGRIGDQPGGAHEVGNAVGNTIVVVIQIGGLPTGVGGGPGVVGRHRREILQTSVNDLVFAEEVSKFNSSKVRVSAPVF